MLPTILIIDDTKEILHFCENFMEGEYQFECFDNGKDGLKRAQKGDIDLILLDKNFTKLPASKIMSDDPASEGVFILSKLKTHPKMKKIPVIMVTNFADYSSTVKALKGGADDYVEWEALRIDDFYLERKMRDLLQDRSKATEKIIKVYNEFGIVGSSPAMLDTFKRMELAVHNSNWDKTVLIMGETGVGKELIARAIHHLGPRSKRRFISINCSAIPSELLESELFGYEKGAFTDAKKEKMGLFEVADGGTVFLDEVGMLPYSMQPKLLSFLQSRKFIHVGGTREKTVDVRIVAATNVDLAALVNNNEFREDLFYRLNVIPIIIPSLKERTADIPELVKHFLRSQNDREPLAITDEAMDFLKKKQWKGNVREIENFIRRVALGKEKVITLKDVYIAERSEKQIGGEISDGGCVILDKNECPIIGKLSYKDVEKLMIIKALEANNWYVKKAADVLEIGKSKLYQRIKEYGLKDKVKGYDVP